MAAAGAVLLLGVRLATWPQFGDLYEPPHVRAGESAVAICLAVLGMALAGYASSSPKRYFNLLFYSNLAIGVVACGVTMILLVDQHHFGA
jgi:hypothetical protein